MSAQPSRWRLPASLLDIICNCQTLGSCPRACVESGFAGHITSLTGRRGQRLHSCLCGAGWNFGGTRAQNGLCLVPYTRTNLSQEMHSVKRTGGHSDENQSQEPASQPADSAESQQHEMSATVDPSGPVLPPTQLGQADDDEGSQLDCTIEILSQTRRLGNYLLGPEIGKGGMGIVYEATEVSLQRRVALKVLPEAAQLDPQRIQRFRHEALAAAQLNHPHIVPIYHVGVENGINFYAMQYVDGQNLAQLVHNIRKGLAESSRPRDTAETPNLVGERTAVNQAANARPRPASGVPPSSVRVTDADGVDLSADNYSRPPSSMRVSCTRAAALNVARLGMQVARALQHVHDVGVVHRDIKPSNLMLDVHGKIWVTDFGLAQIRGQDGLTQPGAVVGTLRYMSPEQATGRRSFVDHRTDIYSLGVTLYELLTLERAFPSRGHEELLRQICFERPIPLRRINSSVPVELETIIETATAHNPLDRYPNATAMAEDLQHFLRDEPINARRPSLAKRVRRWLSRHRAAAVAILAVLILMFLTSIGVSGVVWNAYESEKQQHEQTQRALDVSESLRLAAHSLLQQPRNPGLAVALAAAARQRDHNVEVNQALQSAWDANYELVRATPTAYRPWQLSVSPDGQAVLLSAGPYPPAGVDAAPVICDTRSGTVLRQLPTNAKVASAVFGPRGRWILTTSGPAVGELPESEFGITTLWDAVTGESRHVFRDVFLQQAATELFSPDGQQLLLPQPDGPAAIYATDDQTIKVLLKGHTDRIVAGGFSPDGRLVWTVAADNTIRTWQSESGESLAVNPIQPGTRGQTDVWFSKDSQHLIVSDRSGTRVFSASDQFATAVALRPQSRSAVSQVLPRAGLFVAGTSQLTLVSLPSLEVLTEIRTPDRIEQAQFSPDGQSLLAICGKQICVYRSDTGSLIATLQGHEDPVLDADFIPGHDLVASSARDGTLRYWHLRSGLQRRRFNTLKQRAIVPSSVVDDQSRAVVVASITEDQTQIRTAQGNVVAAELQGRFTQPQFSAGQLLTHSGDTVWLWQIDTQRQIAELSLRGQTISHAVPISGSAEVLINTEGGPAYFWNPQTDSLVRVIPENETLRNYDISQDGTQVALVLENGQVLVRELPSTDIIHTFTETVLVRSAQFNRDATKLAIVDTLNTCRVRDLKSESVIATLHSPEQQIHDVEFTARESDLLTFTRIGGSEVCLWNLETEEIVARRPVSGWTNVVAHATAPVIAIGGESSGSELWNIQTGQVRQLTDHGVRQIQRFGESFAILSGETSLNASGNFTDVTTETFSPMGRLQVWTPEQPQPDVDQVLPVPAYALSVDPDTRQLAVTLRSHNAHIYEFQRGHLQTRIGGHAAPVSAVEFARRQSRIVTASWDGTAAVWNLAGQRIHLLDGHKLPVVAAKVSPDGRLLMTGDPAGRLLLWDLTAGTVTRELQAHSGRIQTIDFDQHGLFAATTSRDDQLCVWDLRAETSDLNPREFRIEGGVFDAVLSPAADFVLVIPGRDLAVSASQRRFDKTEAVADAILIDLERNQQTVISQQGITTQGCLSADGRRMAVLSSDGVVDVYRLPDRQREWTIQDDQSRCVAVAFGPDSDQFLTRQVNSISVWDVPQQQRVAEIEGLTGFAGPVWELRGWNPLTPDGQWLLTTAGDVLKWPVDPLKNLESGFHRNLADHELARFRVLPRAADPMDSTP